MLRHIGAALGRAPASADRAPVRRHSHMAGRCEGTYWRRTDRREVRRVVLAARKYDLAGREPGRANGPLGHVALEVIELLGNVVDYRTGRLEPAIATLMRKLKRSRAAVVRALAALRVHGFLDWLRRYEPTGCKGRGPQVRQVSNAYRLTIPPRALRLLGVAGQDVPLPDDVAQDLEHGQRQVEAMKAEMPLDEFAILEVDDSLLGRALAYMARNVREREFTTQTEPKAKI